MFGVITAAAAAATEVPLCSKLSVPEKLQRYTQLEWRGGGYSFATG